MSGTEPAPAAPAGNPLVDRVRNILMTPKAEWERIAGEPATIQSLYVPYALILAAIGPVASAIGTAVFVPGTNLLSALIGAVVNYVLALISVGVLAIIIEMLAPQFGAVKDRVAAFKVAIYGSTAAWLAGIFGLHPMLGILGLLGLYSVYLIYAGLGPVMRAPADKQVIYTVVVFIVGLVLALVIGLIAGAVGRMGAGAPNGLQPGQMAFPPQQTPAYAPQGYPQQPTPQQPGYQYPAPQPQQPPQGYQYPQQPQQPQPYTMPQGQGGQYPQQQPQQQQPQPQAYRQ